MFYQNSDTIMSSKNGMKVSFSFSALNPTSDIYEKSSKLISFSHVSVLLYLIFFIEVSLYLIVEE